jgi:hypothetical protein
MAEEEQARANVAHAEAKDAIVGLVTQVLQDALDRQHVCSRFKGGHMQG